LKLPNKALGRALICSFGVALLCNALFLCLTLSAAAVSTDRVESSIRRAFAEGTLTDQDWIPSDQNRGFNQYNDCLIMQLIIANGSIVDDALAPRIKSNRTWTQSCATLRQIVDGRHTSEDSNFRYTRYWHGYVPIATFLLSLFELTIVRVVLKSCVYFSLLLLAISTIRSCTEVRVLAWSVAVAATLFWAIPYFGQSLSHAPGDVYLMLGLAGFFYFSDQMRSSPALLSYCTAYGAGAAYFEFWTGQIPTAAGFLFIGVYLVAKRWTADDKTCTWVTAAFSVVAFLAGAAFTVLAKQLLASWLTDAPVLAAFAKPLTHYTGVDSSKEWWDRFFVFLPLMRSGATLTYWSETGALTLAVAVISAWCAAIALAWSRRSQGCWRLNDLMAYAIAGSVPFIWAIIFDVHTATHASFMSRMLILPIALSAGVLISQLVLPRNPTQPTQSGSTRTASKFFATKRLPRTNLRLV
jgi:hypothetical protein